MPLSVNHPVILKPKKPRHTSSTPHAAAPRVPHVKAAKAAHAPAVTHARKSSSNGNLTAVEVSTGSQDNANELAALNGGYFGTAAQVSNTPGNTWTGAYDQYGLPAGPGSGRGGNPVGGNLANNPPRGGGIKIKNIPIGPSVTYFTAKQRAAYLSGGLPAALAAAPTGAKTTATPHVPAVHTPKTPTAPLQLTDSGLQGHDSHISRPPALANLAPVTVRRPGH